MARKYYRLTYDDRRKIEFMFKNECPIPNIAALFGVCESTIYREIKKGLDVEGNYSADIAQMKM